MSRRAYAVRLFGGLLLLVAAASGGADLLASGLSEPPPHPRPAPRILYYAVPSCPNGSILCTLDDIASPGLKPTLADAADTAAAATSLAADFDPLQQIRLAIREAVNKLDIALAKTGLVKGSLLGGNVHTETESRSVVRPAGQKVQPRISQIMENLCRETLTTFVPEIGLGVDGDWKFLTGQNQLTAVYCRGSGTGCHDGVLSTRCMQKFMDVPLSVFSNGQIRTDRIKIPCGCTCSIAQ